MTHSRAHYSKASVDLLILYGNCSSIRKGIPQGGISFNANIRKWPSELMRLQKMSFKMMRLHQLNDIWALHTAREVEICE